MPKQLRKDSRETWQAIEAIAECYQGTNLKRYQVTSEQGRQLQIVQMTNLESLYVSSPEQSLHLDAEKIERYQLEQDDVLVASRAGSMMASVVGEALVGSVAGQNVFVLRPYKENVDAVFLAALLRSSIGQRLQAKFQKSSTLTSSLLLRDLREIEVPIPSLETQYKLRALFIAVDEVVQHARDVISTRQALADDILIATLELDNDKH